MLFVKLSAQLVYPFLVGDGNEGDDRDSERSWDRHGRRGTVLGNLCACFHLLFQTTLRALLWEEQGHSEIAMLNTALFRFLFKLVHLCHSFSDGLQLRIQGLREIKMMTDPVKYPFAYFI